MNDSIQNSFIQTSLDWIKENYLKIIFVFLLLSSIFGWILYQSYIQEKNSKEASILFDEFNSLLGNENIDFEKLNSTRTTDGWVDSHTHMNEFLFLMTWHE